MLCHLFNSFLLSDRSAKNDDELHKDDDMDLTDIQSADKVIAVSKNTSYTTD